MKKKTSLLRGMVFLAALTAAVSSGVSAAVAETSEKQRADLIMITGEGKIAEPELPPVAFSHSAHKAVGCAACHTVPGAEGGVWSPDFKTASASGVFKDFYHSGCVACHDDNAAGGVKSGPGIAECRSCHARSPEAAAPSKAGRGAVEFDSASDLHGLHVSSDLIPADGESGTNCGSCHHTYDATAGKLMADHEPSEGCTSCHGDVAAKNPDNPDSTVASWRDAAHGTCVSCHLEAAVQRKEDSAAGLSGPLDCAGCHAEPAIAD